MLPLSSVTALAAPTYANAANAAAGPEPAVCDSYGAVFYIERRGFVASGVFEFVIRFQRNF